ncbi:MAG: hypothetical protein ACEY26_00830 [Candidatus Hodgkinia cicadicola]
MIVITLNGNEPHGSALRRLRRLLALWAPIGQALPHGCRGC